jgi:hypothetical protein
MKSIVPQIEETTRCNFTETDNIYNSNILSETKLPTKRLERTKPIVNIKYSLDHTLGLKIKKKPKPV